MSKADHAKLYDKMSLTVRSPPHENMGNLSTAERVSLVKVMSVIRDCNKQLELLAASNPVPAARCARKTRHLLELQRRVIEAYGQSKCTEHDLQMAEEVIERIAFHFTIR